jgi:ComF family protein
MLSTGLSLNVRHSKGTHARNYQEGAGAGRRTEKPQRCLADPPAVILLTKQAIARSPAQKFSAGHTEAVFSSTEDRIRASHANAAEGSPPIAFSHMPPAAIGFHWAGRVAESLFAVLFPSDCRICGTPLIKISRLPLCQDCLDSMLPISGGVCSICGKRLFSPYAVADCVGDSRCGLCRRLEPMFARASAYGSYESGLRELIHLLKYGGVRPAANVLGRMLAEAITALEPNFPPDSIAVIPVPLYRTKFRQRGFNQAELIARAAMKVGGPGNRLHLCAGVLLRQRDTASQIGLTGHQRRKNLRGAFRVSRPEAVNGREVLVVDDVFTTGATVSECARVLRRDGATKVWVATVARTLKLSAQHVEIRTGYDYAEGLPDAPEVPLARAAGG